MWICIVRDTRKARLGFAAIASVALFAVGSPASAQELTEPPHVRAEGGMQRLVEEAAQRSVAIRQSIDRLQELDVTVYVRGRMFAQLELEGRVSLLSISRGHRYLVIELACGRNQLTQMATLGHELFHAIEIAEEPSVISHETLAAFYSRIGIKIGDSSGLRTFETEAAAAAGLRARRELLTTTRHSHGT